MQYNTRKTQNSFRLPSDASGLELLVAHPEAFCSGSWLGAIAGWTTNFSDLLRQSLPLICLVALVLAAAAGRASGIALAATSAD